PALAYDFRSRLHVSLDAIPAEVDWREALGHVRILRADPSSMIAAAMEGWDYPMPREAAILADLYDLQHMSKSKKKPKPYPRPWETKGKVQTYGNTGGRSRAQVVEILNGLGHQLPV